MHTTKYHLTRHRLLISASLLAVIILPLGTVSAAYYANPKPDKVYTGASEPKQITVVEINKTVTLSPADLGWSNSKIDNSVLSGNVTRVINSLQQAPVDAKIAKQNGSYVITPSAPGVSIDTQKAIKMVKSAVFARQTSVKLPIVAIPPTVTEASLQPQLTQLKAQQAALAAAAARRPAVARSCAENPAGRQLILVSISRQHLWACNGTTQAYDTPITSGAYQLGMATPTGSWHIYSKSRNIHLTGPGYNYPVSYWMPFYSDYGFHDSSWQTFPYGSAAYASQGSHGCVHIPAGAMAWLYGWAPIGTTVTISG